MQVIGHKNALLEHLRKGHLRLKAMRGTQVVYAGFEQLQTTRITPVQRDKIEQNLLPLYGRHFCNTRILLRVVHMVRRRGSKAAKTTVQGGSQLELSG